ALLNVFYTYKVFETLQVSRYTKLFPFIYTYKVFETLQVSRWTKSFSQFFISSIDITFLLFKIFSLSTSITSLFRILFLFKYSSSKSFLPISLLCKSIIFSRGLLGEKCSCQSVSFLAHKTAFERFLFHFITSLTSKAFQK